MVYSFSSLNRLTSIGAVRIANKLCVSARVNLGSSLLQKNVFACLLSFFVVNEYFNSQFRKFDVGDNGLG